MPGRVEAALSLCRWYRPQADVIGSTSRVKPPVRGANRAHLLPCKKTTRRLHQRRIQQIGLPCLRQVPDRGRSPHTRRGKLEPDL